MEITPIASNGVDLDCGENNCSTTLNSIDREAEGGQNHIRVSCELDEGVRPKSATLWVDVEDMFEYAQGNSRPSGIQRLAFEVYRALQLDPDSTQCVRFVRHDFVHNSFRIVQWREIEELFYHLTDAASSPPPPVASTLGGPILPHSPLRQFMRKAAYRLPPSLRSHVIDVLLTNRAAGLATIGLLNALARGVMIRITRSLRIIAKIKLGTPRSRSTLNTAIARRPEITSSPVDTFAMVSKPGDIILVLGAPWSYPDYATLIQSQRRRGLKFALLVYDLIPVRRPEWCDGGLVRLFRAWFDSIFPLCDQLFAISQATAVDVEDYARECGITLPTPVVRIPIGTRFRTLAPLPPGPRTRPLPPHGTYALIVSTIEARKNHVLLFRVWRRMLEEMSADQVPTLVFAGRIGWLVDDLMQQIANTNNLDGKLIIVENPTDAELTTLYSGCLFTMFPSFFEGWGLPVTESLAFGKPCITSDRTSLPEAGGDLAKRFDPDNLNAAYAIIRETIQDRAGLAEWEARVREEFKPTPWSATAKALRDQFTTISFKCHRSDGRCRDLHGLPASPVSSTSRRSSG